MNFNQTIFLTGFPGFIAERLVARLANSETQFFLLVQENFLEKAVAAIEKIEQNTAVSLENFVLVEGDITKKNLGIDEADAEIIIEETTDVFHLAALYDLAVAKDAAFAVNVEGTKNTNEFVKKVKNLRRYNYVSTCYVAGRRTGDILETELEHDAGFRNFYEESKYLAESEVEKMKADFPVTIFRPSVVVGDSQTGETTKYDGIYYLIQYLRKSPKLFRFINVGNKNVKLNLVPVDFVIEAMATLAKDAQAIGKTLALADSHPLTTEELFDSFAEQLSGKKSVIKPPQNLVEKSLMLPFSPPFSGLPFSAVPYFFVSQIYDTTVADELLAAHHIACPKFPAYVENLLKFVEANPNLE